MSASAHALPMDRPELASGLLSNALRILSVLICAPEVMFLAALTAMLFRPPDLKAFPIDRVAFAALLAVTGIRLVLTRNRIRIYSATLPMLLLGLLALAGVLSQPYQAEAWSLLAAKWIVPIALFHVAASTFTDDSALRKLEIFALVALCYLTATAIFYLFDLKALVFPKFILDEGIGIHADRARGPFLQAVANGVTLNILGLLALSFERRRLPRLLSAVLFVCVPLALLATRTRAVWFAAAVCVVLIAVFPPCRTVRRAALAFCFIGVIGFASFFLYRGASNSFIDRLQDRSPVDFRMDMYQAGWQMFMEKPLTGWGSEGSIQPEIERRISNFRPEYYLFHNTYLELAVERGVIGLGLYAWMMICFFRLAKAPAAMKENDGGFRKIWPFILVVYLLNASAVVMNYQFVNGLVFSLAGILSAQSASSDTILQRRRFCVTKGSQ